MLTEKRILIGRGLTKSAYFSGKSPGRRRNQPTPNDRVCKKETSEKKL